jgi:hypothetical protein
MIAIVLSRMTMALEFVADRAAPRLKCATQISRGKADSQNFKERSGLTGPPSRLANEINSFYGEDLE